MKQTQKWLISVKTVVMPSCLVTTDFLLWWIIVSVFCQIYNKQTSFYHTRRVVFVNSAYVPLCSMWVNVLSGSIRWCCVWRRWGTKGCWCPGPSASSHPSAWPCLRVSCRDRWEPLKSMLSVCRAKRLLVRESPPPPTLILVWLMNEPPFLNSVA